MTNTPTPARIPDVPLPGNYDVLTAQINLTLQVRNGVAKWICALRDPAPNRQIELSREGGVTPWCNVEAVLQRAVAELVTGMNYLACMPEA